MKKNKGLLLLLCLVLCFGFVYSASAETPLSAKQLLINKIQSSDFDMQNEFYKNSSGTASYEIKELNIEGPSGMTDPGLESLKTLVGAKLKLDYKLNSPQKKLETNYDLVLNKFISYKGDLFIDNDKLIFSPELFSLIHAVNPNFKIRQDLPQYVYLKNKEYIKMWDMIIGSEGKKITPELKELLIFVVEAVPDKYFTTSLVNQKVIFSLDQQGLEDVIFSVLQKIKNEKERFASLSTNLCIAIDPTQNPEVIKKEILDSLEKSIKNGDFSDTPENKAKIHKMTETLILEELTYEAPLLPSEQGKFFMNISFGDKSDLTGNIKVESNFTGGKDNSNGTYNISITAQDTKEKGRVDLQINGDFKQSNIDSKSNALIKVNFKDLSGAGGFLDIALQRNSNVRVDKDVQINIPVLTESNSKNMEKYFKNVPEIIVDGKPVVFDIDPFVMYTKGDKRIMAPVRNLAEALGCQVTWVEPNQINISRDDTLITMYINERSYTVNGIEKQLDRFPFLWGGKRTMVPVRFVAEGLGCQVEYDEISNTVFIRSK